MKSTDDDQPRSQLEYEPARSARDWKGWASRFLARLSTPMPLAMYYLITFVLSIVALILALGIHAIVRLFR